MICVALDRGSQECSSGRAFLVLPFDLPQISSALRDDNLIRCLGRAQVEAHRSHQTHALVIMLLSFSVWASSCAIENVVKDGGCYFTGSVADYR